MEIVAQTLTAEQLWNVITHPSDEGYLPSGLRWHLSFSYFWGASYFDLPAGRGEVVGRSRRISSALRTCLDNLPSSLLGSVSGLAVFKLVTVAWSVMAYKDVTGVFGRLMRDAVTPAAAHQRFSLSPVRYEPFLAVTVWSIVLKVLAPGCSRVVSTTVRISASPVAATWLDSRSPPLAG